MEMDFSKVTEEQDAQTGTAEQTLQALGGRALLRDSCSQERPQTNGYVKLAVKVRKQGEILPSRSSVAEPIVDHDAPSRKLADEANEAEYQARLKADHSIYRAIGRRNAESH